MSVNTHLDLFSGIGGFALACEWAGFKTIGFVEIDDYCQKVLKKYWPDVPIIGDIRDVEGIKRIVSNSTATRQLREEKLENHKEDKRGRGRLNPAKPSEISGAIKEVVADTTKQQGSCDESQYSRQGQVQSGRGGSQVGVLPTRGYSSRTRTESPVTLITGGFPCQPFSVAGKRGGTKDDRYLWPAMLDVIKEIKPTWVLGENVAGIAGMEFSDSVSEVGCEADEEVDNDTTAVLDRVCSDLEEIGYEVQPIIIPACAVNAPHRRDRVWIVAHSTRRGEEPWTKRGTSDKRGETADVANAISQRGCSRNGKRQHAEYIDTRSQAKPDGYNADWWAVEPDVGRVAHGVSSRVDRLKCLGNAIVPQVAYEIIKVIADIENV
jgi:DNA (cytosine-5)-methyltransferase 1